MSPRPNFRRVRAEWPEWHMWNSLPHGSKELTETFCRPPPPTGCWRCIVCQPRPDSDCELSSLSRPSRDIGGVAMATKTESSTVTTFTPLSRGRLRCNQTGVIVRKGHTKAYRLMRAQPKTPKPSLAHLLKEARLARPVTPVRPWRSRY